MPSVKTFTPASVKVNVVGTTLAAKVTLFVPVTVSVSMFETLARVAAVRIATSIVKLSIEPAPPSTESVAAKLDKTNESLFDPPVIEIAVASFVVKVNLPVIVAALTRVIVSAMPSVSVKF